MKKTSQPKSKNIKKIKTFHFSIKFSYQKNKKNEENQQKLTLEELSKTGESSKSAGLKPGGIEK
jgi:hypothetical protein